MNKLALSLVFILAGTSFVAYSFLDTFIIPKNVRDVNIDDNSDFSFFELPISSSTSSNKESSSSSEFSSSQSEESSSEPDSSYSFPDSSNISTNEYYENLTPEQIGALFTSDLEKENTTLIQIFILISPLIVMKKTPQHTMLRMSD